MEHLEKFITVAKDSIRRMFGSESKTLSIVESNEREMILNDGKKYRKTVGPCFCQNCCFAVKYEKDGTVKRNKCSELGLGFSKCGYGAWELAS